MSQPPSRAVSPEVAALFNRIDQQAAEYEHAFESIEAFLRQAEHTNRQIEDTLAKNTELYNNCLELFNKLNALDDYINLRIEAIGKESREYLEMVVLADFNNKSGEMLQDFQNKTADALGIMEGASGITQFIEEIKEFSQQKDSKLIELNALIEKLSLQHEEMENAKKEYMKLVKYVNFKMADFETKIDEKLGDIQQQYTTKLEGTLAQIDKKIKEEIYNYLKNKS